MISVVVPVYKVEKYLDKCVQSILAQTYKDFELVLVDDGSPDNCPQMCDAYARKDKRVRVLHKENGGQSTARNLGVSQAEGEFILFIDSDDYISKECLQVLMDGITSNNANMSVVGIQKVYDQSKVIHAGKNEIPWLVYTGEEAFEKMLYQDTLDTYPVAMLIPTEYAKKNPFPVGKYHEDDLTTYKYFLSAEKVAVSTTAYYFYLQRPGSTMHTAFGKVDMDELDAADYFVEYCKAEYPKFIDSARHKRFSNYCQVLLKFPDLRKKDYTTYLRISNVLNSIKMSILLDKNARIKNRAAAFLLLFGSRTLYAVDRILKTIRMGND